MTRLRNLALGGLAALAVTGVASSAFAIESGSFNYLPGASIGIPAGAAPPPGVYTGLETVYANLFNLTGNYGATGNGTTAGVRLGAAIEVVPVVWSTGWQFLGASYSVAVIQPLATAYFGGAGAQTFGLLPSNYNSCTSPPLGLNFCGWQQLVLNTVWQPINLSWNLGQGWFFSAAFSFIGPDGTSFKGAATPDYWTLQPGWALSYLGNNWNISANMAYLIYTKSPGTTGANLGGTAASIGYQNGQQFVADLQALYKFGKWTVGPVAAIVEQTTNDTAGGLGCIAIAATATPCAKQNLAEVGGLIGYDFGPVDIQVWALQGVYNENAPFDGFSVFSRIGFKLWGPEAPKPLVAKN